MYLHSTKLQRLLPVGLLLLGLQSAQAAINNVFPGDFTALKPGMVSLTTYAFSRKMEGPYSNGSKGDLRLNALVPVFRAARFFDLGGMRANMVAIASGASLKVTSGTLPSNVDRQRSGLSDLRLSTSLYPIHDLEGNHHLGINLMAIPPTGAYDAQQPFNIGENRWRGVLTVGWIRSLTPHYTLDLIGEAGWYGDNSDYLGGQRLSQAPSQALTAYLRYHPSRALQLYLGAEFNRGGSQSLNGVERNNAPNNQRHFIGGTLFIARRQLINLRFAQDVKVESGLGYAQEIGLRFIQLLE